MTDRGFAAGTPSAAASRGPLITGDLHAALCAARATGAATLEASLDLGRSRITVEIGPDAWTVEGRGYPYLHECRPRTIYHWSLDGFRPIARFGRALVKLVPTAWGPPTFEIDGIKMLPTARVSPYADALAKAALVEPRGKLILDTCGGLGYFAAGCLAAGAARVQSFEIEPDVLWLRTLNTWSPDSAALSVTQGDVRASIALLPAASVDAILHDPPRFALAGELYSQAFYLQLARVLRGRGRLFHYTGAPNRRSRGRDLPAEVILRLQRAGFDAARQGDGVLAVKSAR